MKLRWALWAIVPLYLLAINPWFMPDQHDDVLYYFGAVNLAERQGFSFNAEYITDWPPAFSLLIAAVGALAGFSVVAAKLLVVGFVVLGLVLMPRYLRAQDRAYPFACTALAALFPISFMMGTRVLSEWPYLAISVVFLLALARLKDRPSWGWAVLVGLLLAGAP